ncbi:auxin-responsive protein SAUR21-like [Vitis riparia]|uniref:auxin-responsive protein SAUR21-like n=1 Tax=Vitis riparia TaxID=96939 RepID=UPI00155ADD76|nr:auxin-responsive protein SAUR21-like [Vitis riparia]
MGFRLPSIIQAKKILKLQSLLTRSQLSISATTAEVPKGHFAVYVGEAQKKRFVLPISYLNNPSFQKLLSCAEEEFGFNHPMGGVTIPCKEDAFIHLTSQLNSI